MLDKLNQKIQSILSNQELKKKFFFTALIFLVFRFLAHVPVPAVDVTSLKSLFAGNQFLSFLNIFAGGSLANFSIVAVGISPYITASIIFQLGGIVFPKLKEMQKDGEAGRAKINQYTRMASVPLGVIQSISMITLLNSQKLITNFEPLPLLAMICSLVAGSLLVMWLGELVTEHGIGNGISMVLFAGIVSQLPVALGRTISIVDSQQFVIMATFGVLFILVISLIVFMNEAVRKINIQYAKRTRGDKTIGGQVTHLPIKVNVAGVMPIIFAVSLMMVPSFLARIMIASGKDYLINWGQKMTIWFAQTSLVYMLMYFLIVFGFTFFSALIFFNAGDISDELKKSGAFVPGIRPGGPTKKFLEFVVTRITLVGAIFLGMIAILPSMAQSFTGIQSLALGGTSALIVVSVVLETYKQVESMLVSQNYEKYG